MRFTARPRPEMRTGTRGSSPFSISRAVRASISCVQVGRGQVVSHDNDFFFQCNEHFFSY